MSTYIPVRRAHTRGLEKKKAPQSNATRINPLVSLFVYGTHKDKIVTCMLLRSATARRVYMCTKKNELGINQTAV